MALDQTALKLLVNWFPERRREMPWRTDPSPYHVWVSEVMLQQTRVDTVIPYYERFIAALPDPEALAACPQDALMKLWEGLGYYSRVRHMQEAAAVMVREHGGQVPDSMEALRKLPGIGSYTAGAVLSIAFHRPVPVVDGNVLRVVSRLNGSFEDVRSQSVRKRMEGTLAGLLSEGELDPSTVNQALMELGALVCIPNGQPKCGSCPVRGRCEAHLRGLTEEIPVLSPRIPKKNALLTVLVLRRGNLFGVVKRPGKGLLSGLYGFPVSEGRLSEAEACGAARAMGFRVVSSERLRPARHVFTHLVWEMDAYLLNVEGDCPDVRFVTPDELDDRIALPAAFRKWPELF